MTPSPDVSVVLPVYNDERHVRRSLESVLDQQFESFEVIVIDDGSTDGTRDNLRAYESDERLTVVEHQENRGLPVALNTGIDRASGTYIMRQDADDVSKPGRMSAQFDFLESHPEVAVVTTAVQVIDGDGTTRYTLTGPERPGKILAEQNSIIHGAVMARRDALLDVGKYDEFFRFCQDYELWMRLYRAGYDIRTLKEPLYQLRREDSLLSVERRRKITLYGLLARAPPDRKSTLQHLASENGLDAVYSKLTTSEQGRYHQRLALAHLEHGNRVAAIRSAVTGTIKRPLTRKTYAYLALSFLPNQITTKAIGRIRGR